MCQIFPDKSSILSTVSEGKCGLKVKYFQEESSCGEVPFLPQSNYRNFHHLNRNSTLNLLNVNLKYVCIKDSTESTHFWRVLHQSQGKNGPQKEGLL